MLISGLISNFTCRLLLVLFSAYALRDHSIQVLDEASRPLGLSKGYHEHLIKVKITEFKEKKFRDFENRPLNMVSLFDVTMG